ncbi:hypothetical protein DM01DRAFT_1334334 [Hesseltinella vesiculosa]|uniref:SigF-like NTF2-like domain-containing protein n=1 Tax=Hesseltinella vesiculosa TaxID=101127 RepID=A0A1X2GLV1_9FUNG|nr:hypothetical protein DM01DRAFT_1334334 [Hesseltinella vesiculosa]
MVYLIIPPSLIPLFLPAVVACIYSYDDAQRQRTINACYFTDAVFTSPLLTIQGNYNIDRAFLLWKGLNRHEPIIDNVCFDGETCVVHLTQIIQPRFLPLVKLRIPMIATLCFRETDLDSGLWKISLHQESWTVEGILDSVPFLSYWYQHVLKVSSGKLLVYSGKAIDTVSKTALVLNERNHEIEHATRQLSCSQTRQSLCKDTLLNGKP